MSVRNSEEGLGEGELSQKLLLYWRVMRATAREKDKVAELERALRELGKHDLADIVTDRNRQNQELTPDSFSS